LTIFYFFFLSSQKKMSAPQAHTSKKKERKMAAPGSVIEADFKGETLSWTCKCGEKWWHAFERLTCHRDFDEPYLVRCNCGVRTCIKFLRSIYSIKMQERILEQQAQQAALLAKVLSMHALGDDARK
jgi:hypothetical protein